MGAELERALDRYLRWLAWRFLPPGRRSVSDDPSVERFLALLERGAVRAVGWMLAAHAPLSDAELEALAASHESPAGAWFNGVYRRALLAALHAAHVEAQKRLATSGPR